MKVLVQEKAKAVELRKKGYTYNEILKEVKVAKSSLSLWLKDLPLTKSEKKYLKSNTQANISRGRIKAATCNHLNRLERDTLVAIEAEQEFHKFSEEGLFQTGVALYWAEGAKRSGMFHFTNSEPEMVQVMILWLERYTSYNKNQCAYRLYVHNPYAHLGYEKKWAHKLQVSTTLFKSSVVKPTKLLSKKRPGYEGCLRLEVPRSSKLLLKMKIWIRLLVEYHGK